ncbi:MAG: DEAD/DEAH box helicase [Deltaproteobacteria bacterium]|nr:DEAD/DEAH box helicase [Deltaproteobacteria bacterium]
MPDIEQIIEQIKKYDWYKGQIESVSLLDAALPVYGRIKTPPSKPIQQYLNNRGIHNLYTHQAQAIEKIREGESVIITTSTASGKSLCYNIPIFEVMQDNHNATALYLYPLKALTNDQYQKIKEMEEGTGIIVDAATYDGDTPKEWRKLHRDKARLILTNPYALHYMLSWHFQWGRFFRNLKYIVIDEAHQYRGVFGSNVALIIRRLLRICRHYGSNPAFILSSASIANPEEFAERLTSKKCLVIGSDGAPKPKRNLILWNPKKNQERSIHSQTKDIFLHSIKNGLQTLCFVGTRKLTELIVMWAKEEANGLSISPYRSGYLPEHRRDIENGLRDGTIKGVVSTMALELGIDIGGLDCVELSGYPGTIASFWQRAGRAGRKGQDSLIVFIAFEDPLDQYLLKHPQIILTPSFENAIIDLRNPYILEAHTPCAAAELPIRLDEEFFQPDTLKGHPQFRHTPNGVIFSGTGNVHTSISLGNTSNKIFPIICNGVTLETLDITQAFRDAHPGAVLLHMTETYLVESLDIEHSTVNVIKKDLDYWTEPFVSKDVSILKEERKNNFLYFGQVEVTERYTGFKMLKRDKLMGFSKLDLPPLNFKTKGLWFTINPDIRATCENHIYTDNSGENKALDFVGGLHALEHAMIAISPLMAMCDRRDIGGVSYPTHPQTEQPTIFIYDGYEGGIGLSEKLYEKFPELLKLTYELIKDCGCEVGCPSCVLSPKCGNDNSTIDKRAAIKILESILNGQVA